MIQLHVKLKHHSLVFIMKLLLLLFLSLNEFSRQKAQSKAENLTMRVFRF